jgi:LPS-assembly lipoprotein
MKRKARTMHALLRGQEESLHLHRRALFGLGAALALSACGFKPIYMPTASGGPGPAERDLAATDVLLMAGRPGQLFRQALQARFGSDAGGPHRYDLEASFWITGEGIAVQSDNIATRVRLVGNVVWTLRAHDAKRTRLASGSDHTLDGFNVFDQQYFAADLENEQVQRRIAEALADRVTTQLAIWFRERAEKPAHPA